MEKLLRKTGITISLRCLLIVASLVFGSSANVWAEDTVVDFSAGLPSGWTKTAGTTANTSYGSPSTKCLQLQKTTTINSPVYATAFESLKINIARSGNGTTLTLSYQIGSNAAVTIQTFNLTSSNKFGEETVTLPDEAQVEGVKFILTSAKSSYYVNKITLTPKTTSGGGSDLTDRGLSFGDTKSFDAAVGGTFTAPTLTGVTDGGVTYESSDANVASVNASTGEVTINSMGHAKITASATANATYAAGSASYDIYVYDSGTIDDMKAYITSSTATDIYFNLTSTAVVTYAATNYAYMEDGAAGIYIYKNGHGLTAGNSFTGKVKATGTLYKELYELTSFTPANAAGTADIRVSDWTIKDLLESENTGYKMAESMRVKLTGVTATTDGTSWTIEQDGYTTTLFPASTLSVIAGNTYTITGYPTNYNGTWEIKVLEAADLVQTAGKTEATVTFDQESYTVETNGEITVTAITNSTSAIVYSISPADSDVLIDAETGDIVAGATAGTYTITATVAENESYTSASASCTLTVTAPAPPAYNVTAPLLFKQITSTDELVLGTQYIIANIAEGKGLPASGTITAVATISEENKANITDNTLVKSEYVDNFAVLTLQKDEKDNYVLINEDGKYLTGANSTSLSWQDTKGDFSTWKISFDANGYAQIATTKSTTSTRYILISSSSIKYYATASTYTKVQLYQKVTDLAISTLTNGYATFVTDVPYVMPKGTCGYAVTVAPQAGVITKTEAYAEGTQVPAQTALLIGGTSGTNYYPAVLKEDVARSYTGDNYMEGKRNAEGFTATQSGVDVYYYKLALNSASKPGFYYGAADGAAFQLTKPTTAYLAVPKSSSPVNGYLIDFEGEETGIDSIAPSNGNADGAVYNLNGIRMTQTLRNLPKGVYIVNGKKVIK